MPPVISEPTEEKVEVKLTRRNFVGISNFHLFTNDTTGETVPVETTEQEYHRLGEKGGSRFNPVLDGHTWRYSVGGAIKVDTPNGLMGDKEYVIVDDRAYVSLKDMRTGGKVVPPDEIIDDTIKL